MDKSKETKQANQELTDQISHLVSDRNLIFDREKLRRTVIKGIPCKFIEFVPKMLEKMTEDMDDEWVFDTVGPK